MGNFNGRTCDFSYCCRNCQKRFVGCHSTCEEYKEAKAKFEEKKKWEKEHATFVPNPVDFNRFGYGEKTKRPMKYRKK